MPVLVHDDESQGRKDALQWMALEEHAQCRLELAAGTSGMRTPEMHGQTSHPARHFELSFTLTRNVCSHSIKTRVYKYSEGMLAYGRLELQCDHSH